MFIDINESMNIVIIIFKILIIKTIETYSNRIIKQ